MGKGYEDFSVGKTFHRWLLIEPIFYTDPIPTSKKKKKIDFQRIESSIASI